MKHGRFAKYRRRRLSLRAIIREFIAWNEFFLWFFPAIFDVRLFKLWCFFDFLKFHAWKIPEREFLWFAIGACAFIPIKSRLGQQYEGNLFSLSAQSTLFYCILQASKSLFFKNQQTHAGEKLNRKKSSYSALQLMEVLNWKTK